MSSATNNIIVVDPIVISNIFKTKYTEFSFLFLFTSAALEINPFLFIINTPKLALSYSLGFRVSMLYPELIPLFKSIIFRIRENPDLLINGEIDLKGFKGRLNRDNLGYIFNSLIFIY